MKPDIFPVLLGSDINVYSMARAFHEEYGVKSLALARSLDGATDNSSIVSVRVIKGLDEPKIFLNELKKISAEFKDKTLILIACADHYVRLVSENKEELKKYFTVPYADKSVMDNIVLKETFYGLCEKYALDYPKTFVYGKETGKDFKLGFPFPVVLKPSCSVSYNKHSFPGQNKVYFLKTYEELKETLNKIYAAGYDDSMIIQEMIPGDDSNMRDLQIYVGSDRKVKLMDFGSVLLEEHTPKGIGSDAATLSGYKKEYEPLMSKIRFLLEDIGYQGFADCDIKYDKRDGKYKIFEINIRQGRSHYRVTGAGNNLARYVTEDFVFGKALGLTIAKEEFFWHVVPLGVVYRYVKDAEKVATVKRLVREGKSCDSLNYEKDRGFKRAVYLTLRNLNHFRKYKKFLG